MRKLNGKIFTVHRWPFGPAAKKRPTAGIMCPHGLRAQQPTIRPLKWPDASTRLGRIWPMVAFCHPLSSISWSTVSIHPAWIGRYISQLAQLKNPSPPLFFPLHAAQHHSGGGCFFHAAGALAGGGGEQRRPVLDRDELILYLLVLAIPTLPFSPTREARYAWWDRGHLGGRWWRCCRSPRRRARPPPRWVRRRRVARWWCPLRRSRALTTRRRASALQAPHDGGYNPHRGGVPAAKGRIPSSRVFSWGKWDLGLRFPLDFHRFCPFLPLIRVDLGLG
jgi:hypothetical protein